MVGRPNPMALGVPVGAWLRRVGLGVGLAALFWLVILLLGFAWVLAASGRRL